MKINALLMDETDNVLTCIEIIKAGQNVLYRKGREIYSLEAKETIPYCHKISLVDLQKDDEIIKYGEVIGKASTSICRGQLVNHNNIYSIPRNYENEFIK